MRISNIKWHDKLSLVFNYFQLYEMGLTREKIKGIAFANGVESIVLDEDYVMIGFDDIHQLIEFSRDVRAHMYAKRLADLDM